MIQQWIALVMVGIALAFGWLLGQKLSRKVGVA